MIRNEPYDDLVELAGEVAACLWEPDDLRGFSAALWRAVFTDNYAAELAPLPDGVAGYIRQLAEKAGAWPDADAVPCPLPRQEDF
jgi:hypothetical protein